MITIKKYGNRRLYDTSSSGYINLEQLAAIVRRGEPVTVVDAKTGADLTQEVLLQVVMEVLKGAELFPPEMLRIIIMATGDDPWHRALREQLVTGMRMVGAQMGQVERMLHPPGWQAPPASPSASPSPEPEPEPEPEPAPSTGGDPEMDALRQRLAALEERLGRR